MKRKRTQGTQSRFPIGEQEAQNCFGSRLRSSREQKTSLTQEELGKKIHKSRVVIANYETGKASPEPDVAVKLALELDENPSDFLLLSNVQRAFCQASGAESKTYVEPLKKERNVLLNVVNQMLSQISDGISASNSAHTLQTHLSLMDFPAGFTPLVVIVGDKREEEPQNVADLFAFSASTVDDRWLMSLKLPPDTEKISDKVIVTATKDRAWLKKRFGNKHILCIASPASNLVTRLLNQHFLFRFAISREAHDKCKRTENKMEQLDTQAKLLQFQEEHKADLRQEMRLFKSPGFVDFNYKHLRLGMDITFGKDFAVVSLGQNPFADPDAPFFSILAAGVHGPGTAHAVAFLAKPSNFKKHPFGGVLEIEVPSKDIDPKRVYWYNKIENSRAFWHTAGKDKLEYEPEDLLEKLEKCKKDLAKEEFFYTDVHLTPEEIEGHIKLIHKLAFRKDKAGQLGEKEQRC